MPSVPRTQILSATSELDLHTAANHLTSDNLVAFPTETVFGLGANALSQAACLKIFAAKNRPPDNPLILHISSPSDLATHSITTPLSQTAQHLITAFWPGPLTLVLPLHPRARIARAATAGLSTVAVRMPRHPTALALLARACVPVAAPSANISGRPSPTCARHVLRDLEGRIHAVIDGEASEIGLESTVVDMTCEQPTVLRPGAVGVREMEEVCGVKFGTGGKMGGAVKSPGMKYRHYAPRAEVRVLEEKNVAAACARARENGACVGLLAGRDVCERLRELDLATVVCGRGDVASYARDLYASLRAFDGETDRTEISASGVNVILAVPPRVERPEDGTYVAVMERLRKAASSMEQAPRHASSQ